MGIMVWVMQDISTQCLGFGSLGSEAQGFGVKCLRGLGFGVWGLGYINLAFVVVVRRLYIQKR